MPNKPYEGISETYSKLLNGPSIVNVNTIPFEQRHSKKPSTHSRTEYKWRCIFVCGEVKVPVDRLFPCTYSEVVNWAKEYANTEIRTYNLKGFPFRGTVYVDGILEGDKW